MVDTEKLRVIVYFFEQDSCPVIYNIGDMVPVGIFGGELMIDSSRIMEELKDTEFIYPSWQSIVPCVRISNITQIEKAMTKRVSHLESYREFPSRCLMAVRIGFTRQRGCWEGWRKIGWRWLLSSAPTIGISCAYTGCDGFARYSERVFGLTGKWGAGTLVHHCINSRVISTCYPCHLHTFEPRCSPLHRRFVDAQLTRISSTITSRLTQWCTR